MNKYKISLRIIHPSIDPDIVCKTLQLEAVRKWKVGEQRTTPIGTMLEGINKESYCCFRLTPKYSEQTLTKFIAETNEYLYPYKNFINKIQKEGGKTEYFISYHPDDAATGEDFDYFLLSSLVDLRIGLAIDIYTDHESGVG